MKKIVSAAAAPLFATPVTGSERADEVFYGMELSVLDDADEYFRVETEYRYGGYILKSQLAEADAVPMPGESRLMLVKSLWADIISVPDIRGTVLLTLPKLAQVMVLEQLESGYSRIRLVCGGEGFIRSALLREPISEVQPDEYMLREKLVSSAAAYLGAQYRWGGKTAAGIDCSGLCQMAYMDNGITIFRDSRIEPGFPIREIESRRMKKGDLAYLKGHVAMYISDGYFIHSSTGNDGVAVDRLENCQTQEIIACGSYF